MREVIGRAIYRTGEVLHDLGLWLCGVAGWWDAGTDAKNAHSEGQADG